MARLPNPLGRLPSTGRNFVLVSPSSLPDSHSTSSPFITELSENKVNTHIYHRTYPNTLFHVKRLPKVNFGSKLRESGPQKVLSKTKLDRRGPWTLFHRSQKKTTPCLEDRTPNRTTLKLFLFAALCFRSDTNETWPSRQKLRIFLGGRGKRKVFSAYVYSSGRVGGLGVWGYYRT